MCTYAFSKNQSYQKFDYLINLSKEPIFSLVDLLCYSIFPPISLISDLCLLSSPFYFFWGYSFLSFFQFIHFQLFLHFNIILKGMDFSLKYHTCYLTEVVACDIFRISQLKLFQTLLFFFHSLASLKSTFTFPNIEDD